MKSVELKLNLQQFIQLPLICPTLRYLTEGSRGTVKDASNVTFPVVKVNACIMYGGVEVLS